MFNILKTAAKLKGNLKNLLSFDTGALCKIFKGTVYGYQVIERIDNKPITRTDILERGIYCIHYIHENVVNRVKLTKFNKDLYGTIVLYDDMLYSIINAEYDYDTCKILVHIVYLGNPNVNHKVAVDEVYAPSNFIERIKMARELNRLNIVIS